MNQGDKANEPVCTFLFTFSHGAGPIFHAMPRLSVNVPALAADKAVP